MPARQAPKKATYRVRNWKQYNDALVRRGSLTLWVEEATLDAWRYQGPTQQGAQFQYSDLAIECLLTLRAVYHLTLRATEGFARSLFELMGLDLPVPDYSTLCRRAGTLRITLPKKATGPLHLVLDSTGLKVYGEGEWKVRKHGYSKRRTWLKLHLAIDPQTHEIQAASNTMKSVPPPTTPPIADRYSLYIAVDDGSSDTIRAWRCSERTAVPRVPGRRSAPHRCWGTSGRRPRSATASSTEPRAERLASGRIRWPDRRCGGSRRRCRPSAVGAGRGPCRDTSRGGRPGRPWPSPPHRWASRADRRDHG